MIKRFILGAFAALLLALPAHADAVYQSSDKYAKPVYLTSDQKEVKRTHPLPVKQSGDAISGFGELVVVERTPLIELNSAYGTSALRDVEAVANNGTITSATTGEIKLSTSATANGSALLQSAEIARYIPGYDADLGVGIRIPTLPTGNISADWGGRTVAGDDGFYFGVDATCVYVVVLRNSTENKTCQSNWNVDVLDGDGTSGYTLDLSDGTIFQIDYTWYGYGVIRFGVVIPAGNGQEFHVVHTVKPDGETSVESPNLNIFTEVDNGGDTTNFDMFVGGRQYSIIGKYEPKFRLTGESRGTNAAKVATSTTRIPLVTFKSKSGFRDRAIQIDQFSAIIATEPVIIDFILNGSLTGASYGTPTNVTAAETALEVDTSASAISGGETIWSGLFNAGQANKNVGSQQQLNFDIPQDQPITMAVRTTSGTGSIIAHFLMREEW